MPCIRTKLLRCYYQYYDLLIEAGNLTNILGKPVSTGCDKYWGGGCPDVGGHWQYLRQHGGSLFNFAFIKNTESPSNDDANFNNANNLGLNHLIVWVADWDPSHSSFSNIAESAWRHSWLRKFLRSYTVTHYRTYLGGDPSDPDSWGDICSPTTYEAIGPAYEVYP